MSQGQPHRPRADQLTQPEPIKYGDVFNVSGQLASKLVAPRNAATMQAAENMVLGKTERGSPAVVMQSAANLNQGAGLVSHRQVTEVARNEGIAVSELDVAGSRDIGEAVGGQVVHNISNRRLRRQRQVQFLIVMP